jgi:hypothetical protein
MKESGKPALLLLFECMGRFFYLEKDREKIFKQVKSAIKNAPLVGLYSGAEFGGTKKMPSGLHTYTSAVISIGDELLAKR